MIGNADNVAGPGLVHRLALAGEEQDGIVHPDGLAGARLFQLHVAAELARGQAQERHPVAVVGVHIGLDLEDKAGDFLVARLRRRGRWRPGRAAAAHIRASASSNSRHAEILQRRAEIDRRQMAFAIGGEIEVRQAFARQLHIFVQLGFQSPAVAAVHRHCLKGMKASLFRS